MAKNKSGQNNKSGQAVSLEAAGFEGSVAKYFKKPIII